MKYYKNNIFFLHRVKEVTKNVIRVIIIMIYKKTLNLFLPLKYVPIYKNSDTIFYYFITVISICVFIILY